MSFEAMQTLPCTIMRGGTSKGIFIREEDLPKDQVKRDKIILAVFGSPDVRQIDGLGGADVLTSKLAVIGPATRDDADVDYTFGQVSFEKPFIDYKGNCGNISAAVGPYAIDHGLVKAVEPLTKVRIHLTNSHQILTAEVPVKDGKPMVDGDCVISGVPGTGARIDLDWSQITGTVCGKLLPTDRPKEVLAVDGKEYEISLVDAGNPLVFIKAEYLGMKGTETPTEIEENKALMETIEKIRGQAAVIYGLVERPEDARTISPYNPFFAIVSSPQDYHCYNGNDVKEEDVDVVSRLLFMLHMHKTYPITGTVCTAAAARIPGTVVWEAMRDSAKNEKILRIGHPGGALDVYATASYEGGTAKMESIKVYRTARKIMEGTCFIRTSVIEG